MKILGSGALGKLCIVVPVATRMPSGLHRCGLELFFFCFFLGLPVKAQQEFAGFKCRVALGVCKAYLAETKHVMACLFWRLLQGPDKT